MRPRKGSIPLIKTLAILFMFSLVVISFWVVLASRQNIRIEDKEIKTQLLLNKFFDDRCFSNYYATFEEDLLTKENIEQCFKGIDDDSRVRFNLDGKNYFVPDVTNDEFNVVANRCSRKSATLKCTRVQYPVTFQDKEDKKMIKTLTVDILVQ